MTEPLRVALVGYGLAGAVFHAPLVAVTDGLALAAVVTGNPERSEQARREHPGVSVFATPEQLWDRSADYDLVVVATANAGHVPVAEAALDAGLPVVVDKPLAPTVEAATDLVAAAERSGRLLTVFHNRRWDGDFRTVRRLVAAGELGDVHRFESRFERWRPEPKPGWRESGDPADAGGLLFDLGSHLVDQAVQLFGLPTSVYAEVARRRRAVAVDDDTFVALTHAGGTVSHLWMSAVAAQLGPRFRLLGSRSAYVKYGLDPQEEALRRGARPTPAGWGRESASAYGRLGVAGRGAPVPTDAGDYPAFYAGVLASLRTGAPPPVDPADAVEVLRILAAARSSATDGRVVTLRG